MSPAEQRVAELVDKWLTSLELHLRYANLTDEAYWQVQPWARHQRPARWILELANTRANELKRQLQARAAAGDASFAEALELMAFLANLVGAQNIERFIPLAERERENAEALGLTQSTLQPLSTTATLAQPLTPASTIAQPLSSTATIAQPLSPTVTQSAPQLEATREMRLPGLESGHTLTTTVQVAAAGDVDAAVQDETVNVPSPVLELPSAPVPPTTPEPTEASVPDAATPLPDHTVQMPALTPPVDEALATPVPPVAAAPAPPAAAPPSSTVEAAGAAAPAAPAIPLLSGAPVLTRAALEARMARPAPTASRPAPPSPPAKPATVSPQPAPVTTKSPPPAAPASAAPTGKPSSSPQKPKPASPASPAAPTPTRSTPRRDPKPAAGRNASTKPAKSAAPSSVDEQVIADAVRLLKWGREWHELAEAIARMADRPGVGEVRKLLRTHKATIETQAAG